MKFTEKEKRLHKQTSFFCNSGQLLFFPLLYIKTPSTKSIITYEVPPKCHRTSVLLQMEVYKLNGKYVEIIGVSKEKYDKRKNDGRKYQIKDYFVKTGLKNYFRAKR